MMRPLLEPANVRSHKAFTTGTHLVAIGRLGAEWRITPTRRDGKSFDHKPDEAIVLIEPQPERLGHAVSVVLASCD